MGNSFTMWSVDTLPAGTVTVDATGKMGLWVACLCMLLPCIWFYYKAMNKPAGDRKFEYLSFTINLIASLAYLTMACGYGCSDLNGEQFFYARYIDWTLTTPLMVLDLILLAHGEGADTETICHIVAVDALMIVAGLIGALCGGTASCWMFFAFSMVCFTMIFYYLLFNDEFQTKIKPAYADVYNKAAWLTAIIWCGYPIAWMLDEGLNLISLDLAVIIYLILDTIAKSGWGILITLGRDAVTDVSESRPVSTQMDPTP